jgi:hypothetical protein
LAILSAVIFCALIVAIVSLATTGMIFGWAIAGSMPLWVAILLMMFLYGVLSRPLRRARRAVYFSGAGYNYVWFAAWYEILQTGVLVLVCWFAYTHVPQVHDFFQHFVQNWTTMWDNVVESFRESMHRKPATPNSPTASGIFTRAAAAAAASAGAFLALRR